jgi:hypothetical protein
LSTLLQPLSLSFLPQDIFILPKNQVLKKVYISGLASRNEVLIIIVNNSVTLPPTTKVQHLLRCCHRAARCGQRAGLYVHELLASGVVLFLILTTEV